MAGSKSVVHVARVVAEKDKAWWLGICGVMLWIPKSVMVWPDDMEEGDEDVDVEIEDWFCVKEGIDT